MLGRGDVGTPCGLDVARFLGFGDTIPKSIRQPTRRNQLPQIGARPGVWGAYRGSASGSAAVWRRTTALLLGGMPR